ncbi:isopenicillin N synthase family dioxygenase [Lentibacter sp. XHP0401]|jgi:isopenicillin N synthase-like dioxygenase|uniref:isopenicillin N synthase family dioxygenase n=1 Tax=Lentibacter sp. XHP0401 TaxID=2984334 RepID=UPI0021E81D0A|nr:2-oxoglutarate and iron-dependent oxygenase domain-containing protein [Lentibacter sp. XHP0401]MCV2891889.1 isopenicillin N synthase family oxygenase [Lentibacter sp. XHP0401]
MIDKIDFAALEAGEAEAFEKLRRGVLETGFLRVANTPISKAEALKVIEAYAAFFKLPAEVKSKVDMARTGSNRGWGASGSEQVDPMANPDYKEVFDCGFELPEGDPLKESGLLVYGANQWPDVPVGFATTVQEYYTQAIELCRALLRYIAEAAGQDAGYFETRFTRPMALLRSNYYPARPAWAGEKDFGIAAHSDYGCLTLLTGDGTAGLEVLGTDGTWHGVEVTPGEFVINFGEMLEMWSGGKVKATLHRVVGTGAERISVPMFFNPNYDTDVSAEGAEPISAGEYLTRRYDETYVHLQAKGA